MSILFYALGAGAGALLAYFLTLTALKGLTAIGVLLLFFLFSSAKGKEIGAIVHLIVGAFMVTCLISMWVTAMIIHWNPENPLWTSIKTTIFR